MNERLNALLARDEAWTHRMRVAEKPGLLRSLAILFAHSGDSWFLGVALLVVLLLGPTEWKILAAIMLGAIFILAVLVLVIKFTVRRERPAGEWGGIYRKTDPHSFPSGHAARATMLAVLGVGLGPTWLALILLAWAPLVVLARVAMGVHYVSDVIAGASLGAAIGGIFLLLF